MPILRANSHCGHQNAPLLPLDSICSRSSCQSAEGCNAATPWSRGRRGGYESFRDLRKRDPEFDRQVIAARNAALARVEETIAKRAIDGVDEPVFQQGELVGYRKVYDNHLLIRLAQRLSPKDWCQKHQVDQTVKAGVLVLGDPSLSLEEWQEKYGPQSLP